MEVSLQSNIMSINQNNSKIKVDFSEKISKDELKEIKSQIVERSKEMMFKSTSAQTEIFSQDDSVTKNIEAFKNFLSEIGYDGKPLAELSQEEAKELISEDGIFGIKQTSQRIANFVIDRAGGDEDLMRAGREGMIQGFNMAEQMWGEKLPEISQLTMAKATEMVDMAMNDLGFSIIDQEV